jgi:hypothetical protein
MTAYPLTLTVEYEENDPDETDSSWDAPPGFAVIRIGRAEVHREPMRYGPMDDERDDLEHAAARWLARTGKVGSGEY